MSSPFAVASCNGFGDRVVVTSPADNSVSIVQVPQGTILYKVKVGSQPRAATCYVTQSSGRTALVSNTGDNTLTIINVEAGSVVGTVSGVPGARGLHGIGILLQESTPVSAWVGGGDANALTVVDLNQFKVLNQIPFHAPTAVFCCYGANTLLIASESDGTATPYDTQAMKSGAALFSGLTKPENIGDGLGISVFQPGVNSVVNNTYGAIAIPTPADVGYCDCAAGGSFGLADVFTSTSTNSAYIVTLQPPIPAQFSMVNGASFANAQIAPGMLASLFAPATGANQPFFATSLPLPTSLGGVSLSVGGSLQADPASGAWAYSTSGASAAPLLFVGSMQINFQVPPGITPGASVAAQLTKADGSTLLTTAQVSATAPGIFTLLQNGRGQAAALNQDNSRNGDPAATVGAMPAARGAVIQIFATGAGATNPTLAAGQPAPASGQLVLTVAQPTVTIGGLNAPVQFSGLAPGFVGLWQINAVVPAGVTPGMAVPLSVSAGGQTSNSVTIAVQ